MRALHLSLMKIEKLSNLQTEHEDDELSTAMRMSFVLATLKRPRPGRAALRVLDDEFVYFSMRFNEASVNRLAKKFVPDRAGLESDISKPTRLFILASIGWQFGIRGHCIAMIHLSQLRYERVCAIGCLFEFHLSKPPALLQQRARMTPNPPPGWPQHRHRGPDKLLRSPSPALPPTAVSRSFSGDTDNSNDDDDSNYDDARNESSRETKLEFARFK